MSEIDFYKPKEVAWLGVNPAGTRGAPGHDLIKVERVLDFGVEKVASMRRKTIEVYGRDGFVLQSEDSYPPVKREVVLHVTDKAVIRPLLSDKELDFYFYDKNEFRRGIVLEPSIVKLNAYGDYKVTLPMLLQPGKWGPQWTEMITASTGQLHNTGDCDSWPRILIKPSATAFSLSINDETMHFKQQESVPVNIIVDMREIEITDESGKLRNSDFERGTFPLKLRPGGNGLTLTGILEVRITGNWGKLL